MPKVTSSTFTTKKDSTPKKSRKPSTTSDENTPSGPTRPPNSWVLFRSAFMTENRGRNHGNRSTAAQEIWNAMSKEEKAPWVEYQDRVKEEHKRMYPEYVYHPKRKAKGKNTKGGDQHAYHDDEGSIEWEALPTIQGYPAQQLTPAAPYQYNPGTSGFPGYMVQRPTPAPYYDGHIPIAQPQPTRIIQGLPNGVPLQTSVPQPQFPRTPAVQDQYNTGLNLNSLPGSFHYPPPPGVWFGGRAHVELPHPSRMSFSNHSGASHLARAQRRVSAPAHDQYGLTTGAPNAVLPGAIYTAQAQQAGLGFANNANNNQAQADYVYNFAANEPTVPLYPGNIVGPQSGFGANGKDYYNAYPNQYGAQASQQQPSFGLYSEASSLIGENEQSSNAPLGNFNQNVNGMTYASSASASSNNSGWNGVPWPGFPIDPTLADSFTEPSASTSTGTNVSGFEDLFGPSALSFGLRGDTQSRKGW